MNTLLPELFEALQIKTVFDCGCGNWATMSKVDFKDIQYIGADIDEQILDTVIETYSATNIHFQKTDILKDPPQQADLWICRDFLGLYNFQKIEVVFLKFLESNTKFIALTSIDEKENINGTVGTLRPINLTKSPFFLKHPLHTIPDGKQWFCKKTLMIYSRQQIEAWIDTEPFKGKQQEPEEKSNEFRGKNIPLRLRSMQEHRT